MKKSIKIKEHLTNTDIYVCYGNDEYLKQCKKQRFNNPPILKGGIALELFYAETGSLNCYLIGLNYENHSNSIQLKGTLVHELSHVTTLMMNLYKIEDDEFRSYLLGYLYEKVSPWLDECLSLDRI
jgi:hypothetical protein